MKRKATQISVESDIDENIIYIKQESINDRDDIIVLFPDQIDSLVKWLLEAKLELTENS